MKDLSSSVVMSMIDSFTQFKLDQESNYSNTGPTTLILRVSNGECVEDTFDSILSFIDYITRYFNIDGHIIISASPVEYYSITSNTDKSELIKNSVSRIDGILLAMCVNSILWKGIGEIGYNYGHIMVVIAFNMTENDMAIWRKLEETDPELTTVFKIVDIIDTDNDIQQEAISF